MPTLAEKREALRRRAEEAGFGSNVTAYQQSLLRDSTGLTDQQMAAIRRSEAAAAGMDIYDYNDAVREGLLTIDYRDDHPALASATPTQAPASDRYYTDLDQVSGFGPSGGGSSAYGDAIAGNAFTVDALRQMNPIDLTDEQGLQAYGPQWSMVKGTDRNNTVQPYDPSSLWGNSSGTTGGTTGGNPDPQGLTDEQLANLIAQYQEPAAQTDMYTYQGPQGSADASGITSPDYGQVQQRPAYDFSPAQQSQPMSIKQAQVNNFHNAAHSDWQGKQQEMQNGLLDMGQYRQQMGLLG